MKLVSTSLGAATVALTLAANCASAEQKVLRFLVPYIPTTQFFIMTAYRSNLSGAIVAPVIFLWNVEKK